MADVSAYVNRGTAENLQLYQLFCNWLTQRNCCWHSAYILGAGEEGAGLSFSTVASEVKISVSQ